MSRKRNEVRPGLQVFVARGVVSPPRRLFRIGLVSFALSLLLGTSLSAEPLKILYLGNSFMADYEGGYDDLPSVVAAIAVAANHDAPVFVNPQIDAANFATHLATNPYVTNTPFIPLIPPPAGGWDVVVMQNYSTEPTHIGNLSQHVSTALSLYEAVATYSPGVVPVLFETWARGPGHYFYSGPTPEFPGGPDQMQQELHDGYVEATDYINANVAGSPAKLAHVGDAWQSTGWADLHDHDEFYHANARGVLLSALVLYSTIYNDPTTCDIDLTEIMGTLGISPEEAGYLQVVCDQFVAAPEPSSLVMLACALVSLGFWRVRRARRA